MSVAIMEYAASDESVSFFFLLRALLSRVLAGKCRRRFLRPEVAEPQLLRQHLRKRSWRAWVACTQNAVPAGESRQSSIQEPRPNQHQVLSVLFRPPAVNLLFLSKGSYSTPSVRIDSSTWWSGAVFCLYVHLTVISTERQRQHTQCTHGSFTLERFLVLII